MASKRRSRGFGQVGRVSLKGSGLRRTEARQLLLQHGWRRVAGEPVASRLTVRRVVGGTLEIEAEPRWAASLEPVLGSLVGRLAARVPDLGIRRYRLMRGEGSEAGDPVAVVPERSVPEAEPGPEPTTPTSSTSGEPEVPFEERLERVARRYLERAGRSPR